MSYMRIPSIAMTLLGVFALVSTHTFSADDGSLRQRLKERRMERERAEEAATAPILRPGDYTYAIAHGGIERRYLVHVPPKYSAKAPAALVVALHGGGGNMNYQADDERYGLTSKADREGFVVVFPNGYSERRRGTLATWNAGRCCGDARDKNIDDVGFLRRVVANVTRQLNIDPARIYATGMSNGGLMSYRLACEASDLFKAIAPVAGTDNTIECKPANPVSVLHIHALNDDHVAFNGGAGPNAVRASAITEFTSVPSTIAKWAALNGCPRTPRRVLQKPGAYCDLYAPCRAGSEVELCVTEDGAHSWPGAQRSRGEPASQAISANEVMWDFFNRVHAASSAQSH